MRLGSCDSSGVDRLYGGKLTEVFCLVCNNPSTGNCPTVWLVRSSGRDLSIELPTGRRELEKLLIYWE